MIHEIEPLYLDNQYMKQEPLDNSYIMLFVGEALLTAGEEQNLSFPLYKDVRDRIERTVFLFSIGDIGYFLAEMKADADFSEYTSMEVMTLRDARPVYQALAGMTARHLFRWYRSTRFCGRCGQPLIHDEKERMMRCPACREMYFPRISPAVVAAVTDGKRLLLTRYANRGIHYALVAGFVEIGESAELCVRREVMEEVGLHVKNVRYFGSQPWGFDGNLMIGYTAELDGDDTIRLDENELAQAVWLSPDEIDEIPDRSSLTREMIRRFREGQLFDWQLERKRT